MRMKCNIRAKLVLSVCFFPSKNTQNAEMSMKGSVDRSCVCVCVYACERAYVFISLPVRMGTHTNESSTDSRVNCKPVGTWKRHKGMTAGVETQSRKAGRGCDEDGGKRKAGWDQTHGSERSHWRIMPVVQYRIEPCLRGNRLWNLRRQKKKQKKTLVLFFFF